MADYDSEIQQLLYEQLTGSSTLDTLFGADKIYLEWNSADLVKVTSTVKGFIVIETLEEDAPVGEKLEVTMRAILHLYTAQTDRATRKSAVSAIKTLFQSSQGGGGPEKNLTTTTYLVWTKMGGIGSAYEDRGLLVVPVYLDIRYLPKT